MVSGRDEREEGVGRGTREEGLAPRRCRSAPSHHGGGEQGPRPRSATIVSGWRGTRTSGARIAGARSPHRRAAQPTWRFHALPSVPRPVTVVLERPVHDPGPTAVERVDERDLRVHELEAVAGAGRPT